MRTLSLSRVCSPDSLHRYRSLAAALRALLASLTRDGGLIKAIESVPVAGFLLALFDLMNGDKVGLPLVSVGGWKVFTEHV